MALDLRDWSRRQLQDFCRRTGLYAGGSSGELEERIEAAVYVGARVGVWHDGVSAFRPAVVADITSDNRLLFEYLDHGGLDRYYYPLEGVTLSLEDGTDNDGEEEEPRISEAARARLDRFMEELLPLTKPELQAMLRERGLKVSGNKDELRRRLLEHHAAELVLTESEGSEAELDPRAMSKAELKEALLARGLSARGTREALEDRLEAALMLEREEEVASEGDSDGSVDSLTVGMAGLHTWDSPCAVAPTGGAKNKRALIVGVSYRGTSSELRGTINDAHSIQRLLVKYFGFEKIMLLTDDHNDRMRLPTKRNILRGFEWLMRDLQDGESLFFYFAGHGGQQRDRAGVEPSGYNQTICPCDYAEEGAILDTQIHKALVKPLPRSVTLQALIDSCHSGTVMNLPWNAELERGKLRRWSEEYKGEHWKRTTAGGLVVQFSAARHDQTAAEHATGGAADVQGAATYSFVNAIKRHAQVWGFGIVYGELLALMHDELRGSSRFCGQEPTLSASTSFDCMDERWKFTL